MSAEDSLRRAAQTAAADLQAQINNLTDHEGLELLSTGFVAFLNEDGAIEVAPIPRPEERHSTDPT
ncbi:hypothetical protein ACFVAJ_17375 [Agromyces sp. NPDC057679]|uniref:hypothetical protein n=1 Tax=Agromyces sp. NPDC057679 TaxID=3346207 RepID=UPI0036722BB3